MQHKQVQVRVERHACLSMADGPQAHVRERSSHQKFTVDLNSIVSAAHRLPAEVAPPPRVWRSLCLQLEKEGIFSACPKKTLGTPAFRNYKEQRGMAAMREEALRQGEAKFRALVESIASAIFISRGNRLRYVNHAAEIITGYGRKELLRMAFQDLVDCDEPEVSTSRKRPRAEQTGLARQCEIGRASCRERV